jgi:hypothetical protein
MTAMANPSDAMCAARSPYLGTTDGPPRGDPGGGITGVRAPAREGGVTVIPGSTFGGVIVPFSRARRSLKSPFAAGAIRSGGGEGAFGGAIGTVGLVGSVGCGFCAITGVAARSNAVRESSRNMISVPVQFASCARRALRCPTLVAVSKRLSDRRVPEWPSTLGRRRPEGASRHH